MFDLERQQFEVVAANIYASCDNRGAGGAGTASDSGKSGNGGTGLNGAANKLAEF